MDMVSPGCDPFALQNNLINKNGHHYALCKSDLDCYGVAKCNLTVTYGRDAWHLHLSDVVSA